MDGGSAHVLTYPLLLTSAGAKFGKSAGNAVWLDPELTSPYQFYQFWINADDRDVGKLLRYFTMLDRAEVEALDEATAQRPERREAQNALAYDVTGRVHGAEAARVAQEMSALLFAKGDPHGLSPAAIGALTKEIPYAEVPRGETGEVDVLELFVAAKLVPSKGAARRLLEQGGLSISGRRLGAGDRTVQDGDYLAGRYLLLKKGARDYALVRVAG
jgi:tyrosyl-tRNA synthetase